ncbi:MAG: hypothetical protein GY697_21520, partial [Desulfobacterales bacterium]|nr:hypothetical protein [Desulfobacterales bacterium]
VLIGGDYQGKNPQIVNAKRTFVGKDASIEADALDEGDGGKVIVWADEVTRYYGDISAAGGSLFGNGGFAEVSGKDDLIFRGYADLSAPVGDLGTLLLDPLTITIANGANGSGGDDGELTEPAADTTIIFGDTLAGDFTISEGQIEALTADILLEARNSISLGSLTSDGVLTLQNNVTLTMRTRNDTGSSDSATGGISFANNLDEILASGSGGIVLQAGTSNGTSYEGTATSDISVGKLTTGGGDITLEASRDVLLGGDINAGAGTIRIEANSGSLTQSSGTIIASALGLRTNGAISLSAANNVTTLAANVSGVGNGFSFTNEADGFTVGFVTAGGIFGATSGITAAGSVSLSTTGATSDISLADISNVISAGTGVTLDSARDITVADSTVQVEILTTTGTVDLTARAIGASSSNNLGISGATGLVISDRTGNGSNIFVNELTANTIASTTVTVANATSGDIDIDYSDTDVVNINEGHIFDATTLDHAFNYTASAGSITDSGVLTLGGTSSFTTTEADQTITLDQVSLFTGAVSLATTGASGDISIINVGQTLDLGTVTTVSGGGLVVET